MSDTTTCSSCTDPITPATEYEDSISGDPDRFDFVPTVIAAGFTIVAIILVVMGWGIYQKWQINQLPAAFTAKQDDAVVNYVTATKDPVAKLRIAVRAAERVDLPVYATESCKADVPQLPKGLCGRSFLVTYQHARHLARYQKTVELNIPLHPGDIMDARAGRFTQAPPSKVTTVSPLVITAPCCE